LEAGATQVSWDPQLGGSLAKVGETLEATSEGLAEIGLVLSVFEAGKLAEQNVTYYTPFSTVSIQSALGVMHDLHQNNAIFDQAWSRNGLTYLGGGVGSSDYVLLTKAPVSTMQDLEGLRLGVAGPSVNWLDGTGAIGVSGNLTTYLTSIKSGVLDGAVVPASAVYPTKLFEVAPYILAVGFGAQYAGGLAANSDWFENQPPDLKEALISGAAAYSKAYLLELAATTEKQFALMRAEGAVITDVSPQMRDQWVAGMKNVAKIWAGKLDGDAIETSLGTYMRALRVSGETPLRNWDRD
jgi:TRAP-type C4-dicarboxylate transport system substrate-binding protein